MSFDFSTLITDRKKSDADYALALIGRITDGTATAEELAEWNAATLKGVYDYTDLNRVTAAMDEINRMFSGEGYVTGYQPVEIRPSGKLPDGYTELEYIESTGTQWIDTGVIPKSNDFAVNIKGKTTSLASGEEWFLTINRAKTTGAATFLQMGTWSSKYCIHLTSVTVEGLDPVQNVVKEMLFSVSGNDAKLVVDKEYKVSNSAFSSGAYRDYQISLFGYNTLIASCEIYLQGSMVRNFVPCKNSLGEIGLYDLVGLDFYKNVGTGKFVAGSDVVVESPLDAYTWYESDNPTVPQLTKYLENVRALRSAIANQSPDVPGLKDMFSVEAANDIEKILLAIEHAIQIMKQTYVPCGATACGGDYL